jgi:hypothetical protein
MENLDFIILDRISDRTTYLGFHGILRINNDLKILKIYMCSNEFLSEGVHILNYNQFQKILEERDLKYKCLSILPKFE